MNGYDRSLGPRHLEPPVPVVLIAFFQFVKASILLIVAALLWLDPTVLPNSEAFSQMLFIAAHGRNISGILIPLFGLYVAYIGVGLLRLRKSIRINLAISSVVTICVSLRRLGVFGQNDMTSQFDRQTLYILILFDLAVYLYLAYHPALTRSFKQAN
jgi:hypothetical protein